MSTVLLNPDPSPAHTSTVPASGASVPPGRARIASIDAVRGLVILLMLVDHTREFFYLHAQVSDPMDLATTEPALVMTRLAAHLCAPVFVLLTGLAAALYGQSRGAADGARAASAFLLKRGLFLVALEWTVVNFAWTFDPTPDIVYLQVIWAIGLSMIALAALVHLPRAAVLAVGVVIILGHNLLDPIAIAAGSPGHALWAVLHDRGFIELPFGGRARTSYPLLPWIGVIAIGWSIGPWFVRTTAAATRQRRLWQAGAAALALFAVLRGINVYGDPVAWQVRDTTFLTMLDLLNLTKYPPSADFLLLTLGLGCWLLAGFERLPARASAILATFGSAPLFFYILHLYALHLANRVAGLVMGQREGLVSVADVGAIWLVAAAAAVPCWFACRAFATFKRGRTEWWWRYL